ncbi:MAG TPA: hypothetical protein VF456_28665 [Vicinamibacterales bacterium]
MTRKPPRRRSFSAFRAVADAAVGLPGVELGTRYDGSPVLRFDGRYLAGLAMHPSAEPNSLVVKTDPDERHWLLEDAPDTYYVTEYYRPYPVVLVRLARVEQAALRDLLAASRRLLAKKARTSRADDWSG